MTPLASEDAVRGELKRILASDEFRSSKRSQEFLSYVVDHVLNGQAHVLKERTIGIDVFGRSADYDPSEDATVRVKASEVRKRLGLYYAHAGVHNPLRIEMPAGTYVPEFRPAEESPKEAPQAVLPEPSLAQTSVLAATPSFLSRPVVRACGVMLLVCLLTIGFLLLRPHPIQKSLDQFWKPVLTGTAPISLCVAFVPVWNMKHDPVPEQHPTSDDFVLLNDQFVGGGDLIATSRLSSMLTGMHRPFYLRVGSTGFADLRATPAVLIGYSYTRWKDISSQMRYFIDSSRAPIGITDNGAPTAWTLPNLPLDRRTTEDFAIVSRVFHPDTHAMLVEIAGITQYGTEAAGDLVTNPDLFAEALHNAPSGWEKKNLQLVLHVKVIGGTPGAPTVVASAFW